MVLAGVSRRRTLVAGAQRGSLWQALPLQHSMCVLSVRDPGLTHVGMQVVGRLGEASSPKVRAKLQQLLQAAVQGVLANDSVSPSDLLLFIHGVLEAGIAAEEAAQAAAQAAAEAPGSASVSATPYSPLHHGLDWPESPNSMPLLY